jgi:flagellin
MSLDKDRILARTAQRNVSDGVSVVNIMTSGLKSQKEILFRMAELSEQSANGTYSSQQREVLQKEYSSLMDEFDRVADSTEFNGIKLLRNPTPQTMQFMAGITGADSSLLQVAAANSHRYAGEYQMSSDSNGNGTVTAVDLNARIFQFGANPWTSSIAENSLFVGKGAEFTVTGSQGSQISVRLVLTQYPLQNGPVPIWGAIESANPNNYAFGGGATGLGQSYTANGTLSLSGETFSFSLDLSDTTYSDNGVTVPANSFVKPLGTARPSAIGFTRISSQSRARLALDTIKNRIDDLSAIEGQYGAIESRLNVAHNLLGSAGENFAAASSRIKDADIATEAANSVRSGILQQAATSLLSQANQAPQIALSLLRGF